MHDSLNFGHLAAGLHGKFAAAKVSTFVVSEFGVVWDFDCQGLCITPQGDYLAKHLGGAHVTFCSHKYQ